MTLQALQDLPITLYNDGTQIRSWCFVSDFVDGVLRCCENPAAIGQAFNIGNPQGTATNFELANLIIRLTNSKSEIVFKPHPGPGSGAARAVDREGDDAARLPADGVARSRRHAGDRLVSRELRRRRWKEISQIRRPKTQRPEAVMKVVVTGASGFIGHNVLLRAPRDWDIVAVYHSTPGLEAFVDAARADPRPAGAAAIC